MEQENRQFAERYVEIEEENNALANLYVASFQLHSTLEMGEVLKIVLEIVINLIGAERFAVYVFDEKTQELVPVAAEGQAVEDLPKVALGAGPIGSALETGETLYGPAAGSRGSDEPMVAIPLRVERTLIGAIAIHALLEQKPGFTGLDRELFTLLAGHAATAICAARLHGQSERKLNTIRGFIDLLTK
jgi:nitrate/nitrite-specific signal transduction histidine kinase